MHVASMGYVDKRKQPFPIRREKLLLEIRRELRGELQRANKMTEKRRKKKRVSFISVIFCFSNEIYVFIFKLVFALFMFRVSYSS